MTPQQEARIRARMRDEQLGRFQGPELFHTDTSAATFAAVRNLLVPRPVNLARPLEFFEIVVRTRLVIGTADYTAGIPEAPQTLVERIRISGNHKRWGNVTPINISGANAFAWMRVFQTVGNDLMIGTTRSADPGQPFVQTTGLTTGAQATYDVELHYLIPVAPVLGVSQSAKLQNLSFLWRPEDWIDNSIQMEVTLGDRTSLGTPAGGTTTTWTAYGSASGNPSVEFYVGYAQMGRWQNVGRSGLVIRNDYTVNPSLVAVAGAQTLINLQKQITTNVMIKSGIALTGTSAGVNVFASLSDLQLDQTGIIVDNKELRQTVRNTSWKNYVGRQLNTIIPQGYFVLPFVESGNARNALRGDRIAGGAQFYVQTDVLTANANNRQMVVQEMVYGGPYLGAAA